MNLLKTNLSKKKLRKLIYVFCVSASILLYSHTQAKSMTNIYSDNVAIIGAGLSGLTAGYYLKKNGVPVQIYEARNRIGGRVQTIYFQEGMLEELGGKELNDGGNAPCLKTLATEVNSPIRAEQEDYKVTVLNNNQAQSLFTLTDKLSPSILQDKGKFLSLGNRLDYFLEKDSLIRQLIETWVSCYEGVNTKHISEDKGLSVLAWLLRRVELGKHGAEIGAKRKSEFFAYGGSDFVNKLAAPCLENIHLNMPLKAIKKQENGVGLVFENGEEVVFSHVILTVPIEILKTINIDPQIADNSFTESLDKIVTCGSNTKILIPVKGEKDSTPFALTPIFTAWWNYDRNVLTVYMGGQASKKNLQDKKQQEEVFHKIWSELCQIYPYLQKQQLSSSQCVFLNWTEEKFSRGSYSFVKNGSEKDYDKVYSFEGDKIRDLFKPIQNKIFFAGEHTSLNHPSTMEGAIESGKISAKMIIQNKGLRFSL